MDQDPSPANAVLERLSALFPREIDLGLGRVMALLAALGSPHRNLPPVVHIAGTNGKGSTLAALRAVAEAAGLRVHVYTSPHLVRFAERIRIAGALIEEDRLAALLERVEMANEGRPITFFEATTAAALLAFAETPADLCLLETGLGGRLDATNVVEHPALTLLASISMDHEAFLGTTLAAIAGEKAGILKPGTPCLSVFQEPEALDVIAERARRLGAPLLIEGRDWTAAATACGMTMTIGRKTLTLPRPSLPGAHQIGNAALALTAADRLADRGGAFAGLRDPAVLSKGLSTIDWPARLQRLTEGPLPDRLPPDWELWLDGGHNPGAGAVLADWAKGKTDRPLDIVAGMLTTKDAQAFLALLTPYVRAFRSVAIPGEPLTRSAQDLAEQAQKAGIGDARAMADVESALESLRSNPGPARVLICGSLYLAGSLLAKKS